MLLVFLVIFQILQVLYRWPTIQYSPPCQWSMLYCSWVCKWVTLVNGLATVSLQSDFRPGFLTEFIELYVYENNENFEIIVAKIVWMAESDLKDLYGASAPVSVWSTNNIPVNQRAHVDLGRIGTRCAFVETELSHSSRRGARIVVMLP